MILYEKAVAMLQAVNPLGTIRLPAQDACGYVLAETVASRVQIPPFANSAMDGFAVRAEDVAAASVSEPVVLTIAGSTHAGAQPASGEGGAWEIMTGAPMPSGYDSVVKIEDVAVAKSHVQLSSPVDMGSHVRNAGEDFADQDEIASVGTLLTPYHIMALAAIGQKRVSVYRRPEITIFNTGQELVEDADVTLKPGQIRNANGPYLMAALQEMGYVPRYACAIADEPEHFERCLEAALPQADIVISTGAVSAGKHDFIPDSLRALGADILFHKVAIRPGKPILYARFSEGTHYFGLPGNPISTAVGLRFFVKPLLRSLQNRSPETPIMARLLTPSPKKKGFRFFRKAYISVAAGGELQLQILDGQESFKIHPMLRANGWAVMTENADGNEPGEAIAVYPLTSNQWAL